MLNQRVSCYVSVFLCLGVFSLLPGCGGGANKTTVKGKVILPQSTARLKDNDSFQISFISNIPGQSGAGTDVSTKDLTFLFDKSVIPGTYKIMVNLQGYGGEVQTLERQEFFETISGKFSSEETPLTFTVTSDPEQTITIDLAKGVVTKY